jgi:Cu(I)/Ag(I) efflux system protein CusF
LRNRRKEIDMSRKATLIMVAAASLALCGVMQQAAAQGNMGQQGMSQAAAPLTEGVVRKVDKDAGKLTIKHAPLVNLDMPAMTMVFRVADPAMLEQVKPGDKVRFQAESIGGLLTVTRMEPAP